MPEEPPGRQIFDCSHLCHNELAIQCKPLLDCDSLQHSWTERWTEGFLGVGGLGMTNLDCKAQWCYIFTEVQCQFFSFIFISCIFFIKRVTETVCYMTFWLSIHHL